MSVPFLKKIGPFIKDFQIIWVNEIFFLNLTRILPSSIVIFAPVSINSLLILGIQKFSIDNYTTGLWT